MATKRTKAAKLGKYKVKNCFEFDNGDIRFNLELSDYGITLYGLRVVSYKKGDFISFPSRKVTNGIDTDYYNHFYIALSDDQVDEIIEAVHAELDD